MREFSQYKFLHNCVGHYLGTLNDDDYDYIYELDEETGELVNESEDTNNLRRETRRDKVYKNGSSRKIDSRRLISREYDFLKTFPLTEN